MLLAVIFNLLILQAPAPDENVWLFDYAQALEQAQHSNKTILIVFTGSDWCKNCIALEKEVFQDKGFLDYAAENLVLLRVDFPRSKKNDTYKMDEKSRSELAEKYNTEGAFPYIVMVSEDGSAIANSGYLKGGWSSYHSFFDSHLSKP